MLAALLAREAGERLGRDLLLAVVFAATTAAAEKLAERLVDHFWPSAPEPGPDQTPELGGFDGSV